MSQKRYIKIEKNGALFILDTHTAQTIEIEDVCVWLNYEWKERMNERNRYDAECQRHDETKKEMWQERADLARRATA
jgi:hypothetical protein